MPVVGNASLHLLAGDEHASERGDTRIVAARAPA
jgi:hypothetical protein